MYIYRSYVCVNLCFCQQIGKITVNMFEYVSFKWLMDQHQGKWNGHKSAVQEENSIIDGSCDVSDISYCY